MTVFKNWQLVLTNSPLENSIQLKSKERQLWAQSQCLNRPTVARPYLGSFQECYLSVESHLLKPPFLPFPAKSVAPSVCLGRPAWKDKEQRGRMHTLKVHKAAGWSNTPTMKDWNKIITSSRPAWAPQQDPVSHSRIKVHTSKSENT